MSSKSESNEEASVKEVSPLARLIALVILATFIWISIFSLVTAGALFFSTFGKPPNPAIPPVLWSLFVTGTVSALCASWLRHWIKNLKMKSITINL